MLKTESIQLSPASKERKQGFDRWQKCRRLGMREKEREEKKREGKSDVHTCPDFETVYIDRVSDVTTKTNTGKEPSCLRYNQRHTSRPFNICITTGNRWAMCAPRSECPGRVKIHFSLCFKKLMTFLQYCSWNKHNVIENDFVITAAKKNMIPVTISLWSVIIKYCFQCNVECEFRGFSLKPGLRLKWTKKLRKHSFYIVNRISYKFYGHYRILYYRKCFHKRCLWWI